MDYSKIRYMHVERLLTEEVEDLLVGNVYVFPKIDGTNGVVWYDQEKGVVKAGSRNRELNIHSDNAGFCNYITTRPNIKEYFEKLSLNSSIKIEESDTSILNNYFNKIESVFEERGLSKR